MSDTQINQLARNIKSAIANGQSFTLPALKGREFGQVLKQLRA